MENKKTTELLDLLKTKIDKNGNLLDGYDEVRDELMMREPFFDINQNSERLDEIENQIKQLKRHKHDEKTNDVLIRI